MTLLLSIIIVSIIASIAILNDKIDEIKEVHDEEIDELKNRKLSHEDAAKEIKKVGEELMKDPEKARKFLTDIGILDAKTGKLSKKYGGEE